MTKAEKKYVLAWTHAQARHYAQTMGWKREEWVFVSHTAMLKGLYGIVLYQVRAPSYHATRGEAAKMEDLLREVEIGLTSGRIAKSNVVNLP
jgi:hypothetical protein